MKVAVISDSHGDIDKLDRVLNSLDDVNTIIHLGDNFEDIININKKYSKNIFYVSGNNDYGEGYNLHKEKTIEIEGLKIFLAHGDRYGVNRNLHRLFYRGKELGCSIVCFGHTHKKCYVEEENITLINPGSISYPRDGSSSIAIIEVFKGNFEICFLKV